MDAQQTRMLKKVKQGKAVLFLGAGASCAANAPTSVQLARMIHEEFLPGSHLESADFMEVCSNALDTPGVDRIAVEDFIRAKLDLQPSHCHLALCHNQWQAIFTTNFDDIVETAYRITPNRAQWCEPVNGKDFSRTQSDYRDTVRLFKLMGTVNAANEESRMALSRSDYNRKLRQRGGLFRLLYDFVKDGTIVYIGYSFGDYLARDIIEEVTDEVGADRLPWGWALLPSWDARTEQLLRQRKVLPLAMTFEDFVDAIVQLPSEPVDLSSGRAVTVTVASVPIDVSDADVKLYFQQFDFLYDGKGLDPVADETSAKRDFLEGKIEPWTGIGRGWAFRRPTGEILFNALVKHLAKQLDREAPILLLTGPGGSGKTTLARVVAQQIYRERGLPCVFLRPEREQVDFLVIDSYVRQLVKGISTNPASPSRLPVLIVVDEAADKVQDLRRLSQFLTSRGTPAVILAVARENEWGMAEAENKISTAASVNLPDDLAKEENEPALLISHLRKLGVLASAQEDRYWLRRVELEYQNSFQTTLYYLAEPTRPPLSQSIKNEYDKLTPLAKQAYRNVCIFYQFAIPLDLELLARSLARSYNDFLESVYDPSSIGVIIDDRGTPDAIRFRARSRMVAEHVIDYAYSGEAAKWLLDLQKIVAALLPQNASESETVRTVLIGLARRRGGWPSLDTSALKALFEAAFEAGMRDSAMLHHFALLLLAEEDFEGAKRYLSQALEVWRDPKELSHFRTASPQHMYNSMGMVEAKWALRMERGGPGAEAEKHFELAASAFRSARLGFFPNAYPYYSESWMLYSRAMSSSGTGRLKLLARALAVLDESEGNVPEDEQASLREMEAKIVNYIGNIPGVKEILIELSREGNPAAQYLQARLAAGLYTDGYDARSAYAIVTDALASAPGDVSCLRLASRLHRKVYPDDWQGQWSLLDRRYHLEDAAGDWGLLFNLGRAACQLGKYAEAARYFEQLDSVSIGHPLRTGVIATVTDGPTPRRFRGAVKSVLSRFEAWLHSDVLGQDIKCVPVRQKFTLAPGQTVTFAVALNYRGFLAIELRPA